MINWPTATVLVVLILAVAGVYALRVYLDGRYEEEEE